MIFNGACSKRNASITKSKIIIADNIKQFRDLVLWGQHSELTRLRCEVDQIFDRFFDWQPFKLFAGEGVRALIVVCAFSSSKTGGVSNDWEINL